MIEERYYACGKGWEPLILRVETLVNKYNLEHPDIELPIEIFDIKEKWGLLDITLFGEYNKELWKQISNICKESEYICEFCGTKENVERKDTHGWIMTLCDKCRKEELKRHNKIFIEK